MKFIQNFWKSRDKGINWHYEWIHGLIWLAVNRFKDDDEEACHDRIFSNPGKINFFWTRSLASLSIFSCAGEADSSGSLPCRGWTAAKGFFDEGFLELQRKWRKKLSIAADTGVKKHLVRCKKGTKGGKEEEKKIALKNAM